jgi:hypothetical protein
LGERERAEWVVRGRWGQGGEMNQALYAHMNNKRKRKKNIDVFSGFQNAGCNMIQ